MKEIKILSIAGRSMWLAHSLCRKGFKVKFFDVTDDVGVENISDQDGPFLIKKENNMDHLFLSFFEDKKDLDFIDTGFCFSSSSGHLCSASPNYDSMIEHYKKDFYKNTTEDAIFWYEDFLKSFGKVRFKLSSAWREEPHSLDPFGKFYLRRSEKGDHEKRLSLIEKRGVSVEKITSKDLDSLLPKIRNDFKSWVVDLTVTELKIFTGKTIHDITEQLGWSRKRFKISNEKDSVKLLSLPEWSVWVSSFYKTWKEDNSCILIKSKDNTYIDIWTIEQVYNKEKIDESVKLSQEFLDKNFSYINFEYVERSDLDSKFNSLFPVSTGYSEINDTQYMWNSPREWMSFNSDLVFSYQLDFTKWLSKNLFNEGQNDIKI